MTFIYVRCEWAGPCRTAWTSAETKSPNYCTIPHHHEVELPSPAKYSRTRIGETKAGLSVVEHLRIEDLYAGDEWPVQDAVPSANCRFVSHMKSTPDVLTCCTVARVSTGPIALDSAWHELTGFTRTTFPGGRVAALKAAGQMGTAMPNNVIACRLVLDGAREHLDFESEVGMMFQHFVQRTSSTRLWTEIQR